MDSNSTDIAIASCCFYSDTSVSTFAAASTTLLYSMPQCEECALGYYKRGRRCEALTGPPSVEGGTDNARVVRIPMTTPIGTELLTIIATAEAGYGPLTFSLAEGASAQLGIDSVTGTLFLAQPLLAPQSLMAVIVIRDAREDCTQLDADGLPRTVPGGCQSRVEVVVYPAVFLNCPVSVNAYLPLDASTVSVNWVEPTLPAYIGNLTVTRDLGNPVEPVGNEPPFHYVPGHHRITYTTDPLSVGGSITCSFDVVVEHGFAVDVTSVGRKAEPYMVQEFLVVELSEATEGSRLPPLGGAVASGDTLAIGIRSPSDHPFAVTPKVSCHDGEKGEVNTFSHFPSRPFWLFHPSPFLRLATNPTLKFSFDGARRRLSFRHQQHSSSPPT